MYFRSILKLQGVQHIPLKLYFPRENAIYREKTVNEAWVKPVNET